MVDPFKSVSSNHAAIVKGCTQILTNALKRAFVSIVIQGYLEIAGSVKHHKGCSTLCDELKEKHASVVNIEMMIQQTRVSCLASGSMAILSGH
jgi:hypothetical protein